MHDLSKTPPSLLEPVARVVQVALDTATGLEPDQLMVVGASCRDILHTAFGHTFQTTATRDLDLALALSSWDAYRALTASLERVGNTGIRFRIASIDVRSISIRRGRRPSRSRLVLYWYAESANVHDRLYETPAGNEILEAESVDVPLAAARMLGSDVAATIGPQRRGELLKRRPGNLALLTRELRLRSGPNWPRGEERRTALISALTRGLAD